MSLTERETEASRVMYVIVDADPKALNEAPLFLFFPLLSPKEKCESFLLVVVYFVN